MGGQDRPLVKQFDKDNDGRLNSDERQVARAFIKKERESGGGGRGGFGPGGPGRGGFGPGMFVAPQILSQADKDGDQKLTKDEFTALADNWFDRLDPQKTGKLSEDDLADRLGDILPPPQGFGPPGGGPLGGGRGGFGPGRFLGPALFTAADGDKDKSLTQAELKAAFAKWFDEWDADKSGSLNEDRLRDGLNAALPPPQFGGRGNREPAKPGPRVAPADVKTYPDAPLYEPTVLRTLFLDFESGEWEAELDDFKNTDVDVPAKLTVDGKTYPNVGVHFRGASSLGMVPAGYKRSLNVSLDHMDPKQRLGGYKTLNLLNSNGDPTFLRAALYSHIVRQYTPAPKVNLVKVVINGESWGVYANQQQFDKHFVDDFYGGAKGVRWKVPGSPGGRGSLAYIGDNVEDYKRVYQMKSDDGEKAWRDLINLCRTLDQTPPEQLEKALEPILDVDGALWFLALENALMNSDGYWTRTSDYNIFRDDKGKFHIIPHDMNETFQRGGGGPGGRGGRGGPGGFGRGGPGGPDGPGRPEGPGGPGGGERGFGRGGPGGGSPVELDPLVTANDPGKTLLYRLLAVPQFRERYLRNVHTVADQWLDWNRLGPVAEQYRSLIDKEIETDTRKLSSYEDFQRGIVDAEQGEANAPGGGRPRLSLQTFAKERRAYLLSHPEIQKLAPKEGSGAGAAN